MRSPRFAVAVAIAAFAAACGGASEPKDAPAAAAAATPAAVEAAIRKALGERIPGLPKIDEITRAPIPGLYEVRFGGTEIVYVDPNGDFIVNGSIIDTRTRTDLTEQRLEKLTAIDFAKLPLKDAIVIKQGAGTRRLAVFVDPNCGYCKRFERDLANVKDITVYAFLMPILGPDSNLKSRDIWCAKDNGKAWRDWMLEGVVPATANGKCDTTALERNVAFGRQHRINGTPALVFQDGTRKPGALPADLLERLLAAASAKKS